MTWLWHPSYVPVRDKLCDKLRKKEEVFKKGKHFVFLCGKKNSLNRSRLQKSIEQDRSDVLVFQADDVWEYLAGEKNLNSLDMESYLADLSDAIIIIVESAGTIAELGAFANDAKLRKKLLLILDARYEQETSFINTGPIRMFNGDRDAIFRPAIYSAFDVILNCLDEFSDRFKELKEPRATLRVSLDKRKKYVLYYLCDLISIIGPVNYDHIEYYTETIGLNVQRKEVRTLLGLAKVMRLIRVLEDEKNILYYRPFHLKNVPSTHYKSGFAISMERSKILGVLQKIESGRRVLQRMRDEICLCE